MASIQSGLYFISSKASDRKVARFPIEDLSLLPKRVMAYPETSFGRASPWIIEKTEQGYRLKANGAPVGERDGKLWAYLIMEEEANEWLLTPVPQMGQNSYVIEKTDHSSGWIVQDQENESQVEVRPLIATRSLPPMYPPTEVFTIIPASD